ncbi:MAG: GntG family PLP-dependent aldolase [Polyangiaceae bacterium]|jgi:threonine aldolase
MIDLRSDTVTRPSSAMREAMARAEVGDDVLGEDPTVRALEEEVARITGKEAALFVTSGTMGNQLAIATQTRPGDDVIVGEGAHPVHHEAGAGAAVNGVQFAIAGRGGLFAPDDIDAVLHPRGDWTARTALVAIENTHNGSGGRVWPYGQARAVADRARDHGLATHLDGARIWNASVASDVDVATLCAPFDTASVCFSKGLGAPVGSALCGPRELVRQARRFRKMWGGAMRQSGILAAGALFALAHHRERLADDHANARRFAEKVTRSAGARVDFDSVQTNIVNVDVDVDAGAVSREARGLGVLISATGPHRLRAVTHLDVSRADVESAAEALGQAIARVIERRI